MPYIPTVLFEDTDILVINKPAGITVNISDTTKGEQTVQDWVEETYPGIQQASVDKESDFYKRSGIVHRLDKETSGILLAAKKPFSFEHLQKQFKERVVKKTYIALAHGKIVPETGEINVPVGRLEYNRKRFGIVAGGRESVTHYSILRYIESKQKKKSEVLTLVELYPQTGRTHQIRVHLKYINHPIFADFLYAGRKTAREDRNILARVFLHAAKISFVHPTTNEVVSFESVLPTELEHVLQLLSQ